MENSFLSEFKKRDYFNQCTNSDELENLMNQKKIRAYIGFDCTSDSLHVGSLLPLMILRNFQKFGHKPIILVGGGTTLIGDTYGKDETRKILSSKDIDIPSEKVFIASQLCLATLSVGYREENHISPRYVTEAKKAVLAYLTSA